MPPSPRPRAAVFPLIRRTLEPVPTLASASAPKSCSQDRVEGWPCASPKGCRGLGRCVCGGGQGKETSRSGVCWKHKGRLRPAASFWVNLYSRTTSLGGSHGTCGGSSSGSGRSPLSSHRQYGGDGGGDTQLGRQPQGPERGCSHCSRKRKPPPTRGRGGSASDSAPMVIALSAAMPECAIVTWGSFPD